MATERVLLCEDDPAIRILLVKLLERRGLTVRTVANGVELLDELRQRPFDLLILDLFMPGVNGFDILESLRDSAPHLLERVVVVTANQLAFRTLPPVAAILRKPFDIDEFDELVDRTLNRRPPRLKEAQP